MMMDIEYERRLCGRSMMTPSTPMQMTVDSGSDRFTSPLVTKSRTRSNGDRFIPRRIDFDAMGCDLTPSRRPRGNTNVGHQATAPRGDTDGTNTHSTDNDVDDQSGINTAYEPSASATTYERVLRSELFGTSHSQHPLTPSDRASHTTRSTPSPLLNDSGLASVHTRLGIIHAPPSPPYSLTSPTALSSAPTTLAPTTGLLPHLTSAQHTLLASAITLPTSRSPPRVLSYRATQDRASGADATSPYSVSPISRRSQQLLRSPPKTIRKISQHPVRTLEAPGIKDDFYLNLLDWSAQNVLAVGLGSAVHLWNASTSSVAKLVDLGVSDDCVTSVQWDARGTHLAVGTNKGLVQQWDVVKGKKLREVAGHKSRVGALAWRETILTSGGRDRLLYNRDMRDPAAFSHRMIGHRQEVCGLEWSPDLQHLASGGNDNRLMIWDIRETSPLCRYTQHSAAVKAIAWSPHERGVLASGGGTADRCIRFWNVAQSRPLHCIDTGSQVCNLAWSQNVNEIVSTHGYSQNQIALWSYPDLRLVTALTGHTTRVLYLSVSPDGQTIVTGAGDETLRFWDVFPASSRGGYYSAHGKLGLSDDHARVNVIR
eukprot:TRINITY_DN5377_c1_g1_i1.p1 TRINITY_DN5377_c1_g1~~TRINITY_DN5377_c1_g1_i1.p1  ORF type:complete len:598 (-),score=79.24 TRINITY_DN5377_c1_g1_i1:75-1868(-)